jgi:hypothetical protein
MAAELGFLGPLITVLKELGGYMGQRFRKPDPVAVLEGRKRWKGEFEQHLRRRDASGTRGDAIIRDIKRMDHYPELEDTGRRRVSAWFKVEVKGLYHRGVEAFLSVETLVPVNDGQAWRLGESGEPEAINALLVGRIPFDRVRSVDWEGDGYYPFPHIYCDFTLRKGQPYEDLVFYAAHEGRDGQYFMEVARLDAVRRESKRHGIKHWSL